MKHRYYMFLFMIIALVITSCENNVITQTSTHALTPSSTITNVEPSVTPSNLVSNRIVLTPSPTLSNQSTKEPFSHWILGSPECKLPCWGGITIGKTSLDDAYLLINPVLKLDALRNSVCRLGQCKWYPWASMLGEKPYSGAVLSKEEAIVYAITVEGDYSEEVSFPKLLSLYGNPSKIFVYAHTGMPPDNIAPFDLILLYSQEKFVVRYRWLTESSGENIKACGTPQYFTLSAIQHAEAEWTDLEIDQTAHQLKYTSQVSNIKPFQEATGIATDQILEKIQQEDPLFCISTPAKKWGG